MKNHEAWHTCEQCQNEYDARLENGYCPACGANYLTK